MGKRGPRKQPTLLKVLRGNPGKRPLNKNEPLPAADNIHPPKHLKGLPLEKWHEITPTLIAIGVMTNLDVDPIARWCTMYEQALKCSKSVAEGRDQFPVYGENGKIINLKSTPDAINIHKYYAAMLRIEQEYGMTASSRSAIVVKKPKRPEEEIDPRIFG